MDSWIALCILIASILIAASLNDAKPAVRAAGSFLASLGCFSLVGWFIFVLETGVLNNFSASTPFESLKPTLLWTLAVLNLFAGLFLLRVAFSHRLDSDNEINRPVANSETHYGQVTRYIHWTTAALMLVLIPIGIFATMIPEEGVAYRILYYKVHKTLGLTVLVLVLFRMLWHLRSPVPVLDSGLNRWEVRLAKSAHFLLYAILILMPVSGFLMSTYGGKPSSFFFLSIPPLWEADLEIARVHAVLHKFVLPYAAYVIIGAHVLGALKHHYIDKHTASLHRMVS